MRRAARLVAATLLAAAGLVDVTGAPAGATDVGNAAEFADAWQDATETSIVLTASFALDCDHVFLVRESTVDLTVDGDGNSIGVTCDAGVPALSNAGVDGDAGSVTFESLFFQGNEDSGTALESRGDVNITESSFVGHGTFGVTDFDVAPITSIDIHLNDSSVSGNGEGGLRTEGGVHLRNGSGVNGNGGVGIQGGEVTVENSSVSANATNDDAFYGVFSRSTVQVFEGSSVSGNHGHGIHADSGVYVEESNVNGNTGTGIVAGAGAGGGDADTNGSSVSGNGAGGIEADGGVFADFSEINGNTNGAGIWATEDVSVYETNVNGNGGRGVDALGNVDVESSGINGNTDDGIVGVDVGVWDSRVNGNGGRGIDAEGSVDFAVSQINGSGDDGIRAAGVVYVEFSELIDNGSDGIDNDSTEITVVLNSIVYANDEQGIDGSGVVELVGSTVAFNAEEGVEAGGDVHAINSTVVENAIGILSHDGDVSTTYLTIVGNGTGVTAPSGSLHLSATALAYNGVACGEPVASSSYTWADDLSCALTGTGDFEGSGANPLLGPLTDNGGDTPTMLPAEASRLVSMIPEADCPEEIGFDQRGENRPNSFGACTVGAVEVDAAAPPSAPTPTIELDVDSVPAGGDVEVTGEHFAANGTTTFTLFSDPIDLGSVSADGDGAFVTTLTIPTDAEVGEHTLVAEGTDAEGRAIVLEVPLTVTSATPGGGSGGPDDGAGSGGDGALAFTGLAPLLALAGLAAIGAGTFLARRVRRVHAN